MALLDISGLIGFLFLSVVFFITARNAILYHVLSALILIAFVVLTESFLDMQRMGTWVVMTTGLILYWFGLAVVRIMLVRSVSLRMLSSYAQGTKFTMATEGISTRLEDAKHFGLVVLRDHAYALTPFGRLIAGMVAFCYGLFRVK